MSHPSTSHPETVIGRCDDLLTAGGLDGVLGTYADDAEIVAPVVHVVILDGDGRFRRHVPGWRGYRGG